MVSKGPDELSKNGLLSEVELSRSDCILFRYLNNSSILAERRALRLRPFLGFRVVDKMYNVYGLVTPRERESEVTLLGSYYFQFTCHTRQKRKRDRFSFGFCSNLRKKGKKRRARVRLRLIIIKTFRIPGEFQSPRL